VSDKFAGGSAVVDQARLWQRLQASLFIAFGMLFGLGGLLLAIAPSSDAGEWLPIRIFLAFMGALGLWGVMVGIRTFRARIEIDAAYVTLHRARGKLRVPLHDVLRVAPSRVNRSRRSVTPWCLAVELVTGVGVMLVDAPGRRDDIEVAAQRANEMLAAFKTGRDRSSQAGG
jgi:hypothetical protein